MGLKFLVVDNQPLILKLMSNLLEKRGHEVRTAENSLSALETLEDFVPDIMFVDLVMPYISGDKLCRIVRSMPALKDVCIIVLSGIAAEEEIDFKAFGADACIAKGPFKTIEHHVAEFLEKQHATGDYRSAEIIGLDTVYKREITKELLTSRKHFETIIKHIDEGIIECTREGKIVYSNTATAKLVGVPEEKILAENLLNFFSGSSKKMVLNALGDLDNTPVLIGEDKEHLLLNGRRIAMSILPVDDQGVKTTLVIIHDITQRKHTEEKLDGYREHLEKMVVERTAELTRKNEQLQMEIAERQQAEEKMTAAQKEWDRTFDAIDDIVTLQDKSMRITRVNDATCRILEKTTDELIGKHCYEVFRGESTPCPDCPEHIAAQTNKSFSSEVHHPKLGKSFLVTATPITDDSGKSTGIAHFAKDITEQKRLEAQLLQGQKMEAIGTLAGGIAHDFNNILSAVLGYTELAMLDLPPDHTVYDKLAEVNRAGQRAKDLVAQILAFSRHSEARREPLEVRLIIKEALKLMRASLPSTIDIQQRICSTPAWVLADPVQVHQVLMNLCTNASHAMQENGGVLQVDLDIHDVDMALAKQHPDLNPGPYVCLVISDSGHGMENEVRERAFEPFFTTKDPGEGTGMGLAVVHGIVKNHNGAVLVESEPGKGSTFRLFFPHFTEIEKAEPVAPKGGLPRGNERVLFVDDEPAIVDLGRELLQYLGYDAVALTDSQEALKMFLADPTAFDLLITDLTMPQVTGAELATQALAVRPDLPIIMCTGYSEIISEEQAKAIGIREYVLKPLVAQKLAEVVRSALDGTT